MSRSVGGFQMLPEDLPARDPACWRKPAACSTSTRGHLGWQAVSARRHDLRRRETVDPARYRIHPTSPSAPGGGQLVEQECERLGASNSSSTSTTRPPNRSSGELYPKVVDALEKEGGVPSRLINTRSPRGARKEGTPGVTPRRAGRPAGGRSSPPTTAPSGTRTTGATGASASGSG